MPSALGRCLLVVGLVVLPASARADTGAVSSSCSFKGISLYGNVQVVDHFPDIEVKVVDHFPDLNVKMVDHFPDRCGLWKKVDHFPDFKIKYVEHFPDIEIKLVDHFPGLP